MTKEPRKVVSDGKALKALAHPLRQKMLQALDSHREANSTTIAKALGESTGTTSYHLRVLADAGIIENIPERSTGRERWYRTVPTDRRAPEYDSLSAEDKAAYDAWAQLRIPGELRLVQRMAEEYNKHGKWLNLSRSSAYYTVDDLEALFEDYITLLNKYGRSREDAPPDARRMHLRFFYLPDESESSPDPHQGA